jgi:hypothetical protein
MKPNQDTATEPKQTALAAFLECEPEELTLERHEHYGLEIYSLGSKEFAIGDNAEADAACAAYVKDNLWAFNASFLASETDLPEECFAALSEKFESGNDAVLRMVEKTCGLNSFVQSAISADGRGHFLSGYDGEETEQDGFYIYRIN